MKNDKNPEKTLKKWSGCLLPIFSFPHKTQRQICVASINIAYIFLPSIQWSLYPLLTARSYIVGFTWQGEWFTQLLITNITLSEMKAKLWSFITCIMFQKMVTFPGYVCTVGQLRSSIVDPCPNDTLSEVSTSAFDKLEWTSSPTGNTF